MNNLQKCTIGTRNKRKKKKIYIYVPTENSVEIKRLKYKYYYICNNLLYLPTTLTFTHSMV
jgi:hypothetical protein